MSFLYAATSQPPTAVNFSVTCHFTSPSDQNLIVVRSNRLEIFTFLDGTNNPEGAVGLRPVMNVPLFGRVKGIEVIPAESSGKTDQLFILIERKKFSIISYDEVSKKVVTNAICNVKERVGCDTEMGQRSFIDPQSRVIGLQIYDGLIKIVPLMGNEVKDSFNVTLDQLRVIDIKFLNNQPKPVMCVLYEGKDRVRHVKTFVVEVKEKNLSAGPWHQNNVEYGASMLIPVPMGGVLVVGQCSVTYLTGVNSSLNAIELSPCQIAACSPLDASGTRFLLGDSTGKLMTLALTKNSKNSSTEYSMTTDLIGVTSIAESINVLSKGLVFIGSALGDSQLIKLHANGEGIEVLDAYNNVGPILDMVLVEDSIVSGGQKQLVTCSGAYKEGSIRVMRDGIGLLEQASLDIDGIKGLWSLKSASTMDSPAAFDSFLVQSFLTETRVFGMEGEEMSEASLPGMDSLQPTLFCGNMDSNVFVQVTPISIRLIDLVSMQLVQELPVPMAGRITTASGNPTQLVVTLSGGRLQYLELRSRLLELVGQIDLDQDVACQSMQPLPIVADASVSLSTAGAGATATPQSALLSVGMWTDNTVRLLALPTLQEVARVHLGTETQARDVLLVAFESRNALTRSLANEKSPVYLLVGMGDGVLLTYNVDFSSGLPVVSNRKRGVLGTRPVTLRPYLNNEEQCVFACGDRPSVLYSKNNKLLFSVIDIHCHGVVDMTSFHAELFPDCVAFASETTLHIGTFEEFQKLHMQTISLNEAPRRIVHCPESRCYAVCTEKVMERGEVSTNRILVLDDVNFTTLAEFELDPMEQALSIAVVHFASDPKAPYLVVGTAQVVNEELEPSRGRLLVFQISGTSAMTDASMHTDDDTLDRKMTLVTEKELRSGAYTMTEIEGKLAVGIGSKVQIYSLAVREGNSDGSFVHRELQAECSHQGHVMVLYLKACKNFLAVGDLIRSITLLQYRTAEGILEEVSRDFNCSFMRAVEFADTMEDHVLGADGNGNLFCGRRQTESTKEEDRLKLEIRAEYHLGDYVNVMRRGALQSRNIGSDTGADSDSMPNASHLLSKDSVVTGIFNSDYKTVTGYPSNSHSVLYGTVSGAIGTLLMLTESSYQFFSAVERATKDIVNSIGNFPHSDWRNFQTERRLGSQKNVVDGDLVEMLLDLEDNDLDRIVRKVNDDLTAYLQNLAAGNGTEKNGTGISSESASALIANLQNNRVDFSRDDIVRRVEDIMRLH